MATIPGTLGPITQDTGSAPVEGTNAIQTITIGGTPNGGSYRLGFNGRASAAIPWSGTDATLVANTLTGLTGRACVQTITFAGISGGTFVLGYKGQVTAPITWSATNNTLRDRVDAALELLANIGSSGVVTAVGTMTAGIGTLTVTFAARGLQPPLQIAENRLTGSAPAVSVAITTAGIDGPFEDGGVGVAEDDLTSGVGTIAVTFSGTTYTKREQPLIEVISNDLTGSAPTVDVSEDTAGVDAFARGILVGGEVADTNDGTRYLNAGTPNAPDWSTVTAS